MTCRTRSSGAVAFVALVALLALSSMAQAAWTQAAAGRVAAGWAPLSRAADAFGVEPEVLAAVCGSETELIPMQGGTRNEMHGACQVRWITWGWLLRAHGIAHEAWELDADLEVGLLAGAAVLSY